MRLTLVTYSLGCGGAQRVLTTLANGWRRAGHTVTIVALRPEDEPPFFPLDPAVSVEWLAVAGDSRHPLEAVARNLVRVQALRAAFRRTRPDVVVSFLNTVNVLVLLATAGGRIPVIVSERNDPGLKPLPRAWRWLRNRVYGRARAIVVQTRRTAEWFPPRLRQRMVVIPNAVALPDRPAPPRTAPARGGTVLAVGRLEHQKGFDLLVRAFAQAARQHAGWRLAIAGEGSQRAALEAQAAAGGIADRVRLLGRQADIWSVYAAADVFALPSRFEGFPNALIEAMAAGLPVVAADCPTGPREIVRDERDGLLIPTEDENALGRALSRLMGDADLRARLAAGAVSVVDRFRPDAIQRRWDTLVADVSRRQRSPEGGRSDPDEPRSPASEGRAAELDERDQGEGNLQEEDPDE